PPRRMIVCDQFQEKPTTLVNPREEFDMRRRCRARKVILKVAVERLEGRALPSGLLVAGARPGQAPVVHVLDAATGAERFQFLAFPASYRGGVRVAVGDVNDDGTPDVIAAAGPGKDPRVRVFDGQTGNPLPGSLGDFDAFAPTFRGGVSVSAGDFNGDGFADVIVGAGSGGS